MQPSASRLTFSPVLPRRVYCIVVVPSSRCRGAVPATRRRDLEHLPLDDVMDLDDLGRACELDAGLAEDRHQSRCEGLELLPGVPDLADPNAPAGCERDVVVEPVGRELARCLDQRHRLVVLRSLHARCRREPDKNAHLSPRTCSMFATFGTYAATILLAAAGRAQHAGISVGGNWVSAGRRTPGRGSGAVDEEVDESSGRP